MRKKHTIKVKYSPRKKFLSTSSIRSYSTQTAPFFHFCINKNKKEDNNLKDLNALIRYDNFKEDRLKILKEQNNKSGVYCLINNINGLIRLKIPGFKEACALYNIDFIEANYNIGLYDPYFAGLVDTDGSIVFNYYGNRM